MAGEERKGSRLGRALSVVFGFGGGRQGSSKASTSVVPVSDTSAVDGVSCGAVTSNEEEINLLNQAIAESGLGILVKVDAAGRILQANEGMELATGLARETLIGTVAFPYFGNPDRAKGSVEALGGHR